MGIDTWTPRSIWQAVPMEININTITRKVLHTISMHIRETDLYQHNHLMGEVALSLPLARMNGTRSEETITRKVSSLLLMFKNRAHLLSVERRRRETINEGINELAKIVPNCEKNKGSILQRGVQYITQLKENETRNIEKWTLEKLLTDQAIAELSSSVERLKNDLSAAYKEVERWKKTCLDAGLEPKDDGGTDDDGDS